VPTTDDCQRKTTHQSINTKKELDTKRKEERRMGCVLIDYRDRRRTQTTAMILKKDRKEHKEGSVLFTTVFS